MRELALHLMDIVQNGLRAGAQRIDILIAADSQADKLTMQVKDNGCGMDEKQLSKVTDPYHTTRTTRSIGLGLPLLKEHCILTGGSLTIDSQKGLGTTVTATFGLSNIDRLPLGNIAETMSLLILSDPDIDYSLTLLGTEGEEVFDLAEIRKTLEDVPVNDPTVLEWITGYLEQKMTLFGGALNEIIS